MYKKTFTLEQYGAWLAMQHVVFERMEMLIQSHRSSLPLSAVYDADATWRSAAAEVEQLLRNFSSGAPPHEDLQKFLWYRGADKAGFEYAKRSPVESGPHAQYLGF